MSVTRTCDRCGGPGAHRAVVTLRDGSRYLHTYAPGDLCATCAQSPGRPGIRGNPCRVVARSAPRPPPGGKP